MEQQIYQQQWIALERDVRTLLFSELELTKSGPTEVKDETVISDGVTNADLQMLTAEKLSTFIGSKEESLGRAWELTIKKAYSILYPPAVTITPKKEEIAKAATKVIKPDTTKPVTPQAKPITTKDGKNK
jgi:hypothetical protein